MASTSAPMNEMKGLGLAESCMTNELVESEFHTAVGCGSEYGNTSCCVVGSESVVERVESGNCGSNSELEEKFESSEVYWSEVSELATNVDEEGAAEIDNKEVFKTLLMHPIAPHFFETFGYDLGVKGRFSAGELVIGEKFAEGGQAELFHVKVTWEHQARNAKDLRLGIEWVLKVFKKGTSLRYLQSQWPEGYLQSLADRRKRWNIGKPNTERHYCAVWYATLLEDGRFAFLMVKEDGDLRSMIDKNMETIVGRNQGPFEKEKEDAEMIMYYIALGMDWMHNHNIILRDLKAANVLMSKTSKARGQLRSLIADFECSVGVVGTGVWRAPEILQACKDRNVSNRPELFTTQADIYSYGMTCYEILTGRYPFDKHGVSNYDLVLDGNRPEVPEYVEDWARGLLKGCWQTNPLDRLSVKDVLKVLEDSSQKVRDIKVKREARERALMCY